MPKREPGKTTVNDLMGDNALGSLRHLGYFEGYTRDQLREFLKAKYPNARSDVIENVLDKYADSRQAAGRVNRAGKAYKVDRENMPQNRQLPQMYRYVVNMIFTDSQTGEKKGYLAVIDSGTNLSRQELYERGKAMADTAHKNKDPRKDSPPGTLARGTEVTMYVVSVECRTCR